MKREVLECVRVAPLYVLQLIFVSVADFGNVWCGNGVIEGHVLDEGRHIASSIKIINHLSYCKIYALRHTAGLEG